MAKIGSGTGNIELNSDGGTDSIAALDKPFKERSDSTASLVTVNLEASESCPRAPSISEASWETASVSSEREPLSAKVGLLEERRGVGAKIKNLAARVGRSFQENPRRTIALALIGIALAAAGVVTGVIPAAIGVGAVMSCGVFLTAGAFILGQNRAQAFGEADPGGFSGPFNASIGGVLITAGVASAILMVEIEVLLVPIAMVGYGFSLIFASSSHGEEEVQGSDKFASTSV